MSLPPDHLHRGPGERFATWVVTGPLGHLWSVTADISVFAAKSLLTRMRRRTANGAGR